jgi:hypothetical protein
LDNDSLAADTEGGAPPPVFSALDNPLPVSGGSNAFGLITAAPVKIIEEYNKKNHVKIFIYEISGAFYFGYQLKVERIIRQKPAKISDTALSSAEAARMAARDEIKAICGHSRFIRDIFEDFTVIKYNQMELF